MNFREYKQMDLPWINQEVRDRWEKDDTFQKHIDVRRHAQMKGLRTACPAYIM